MDIEKRQTGKELISRIIITIIWFAIPIRLLFWQSANLFFINIKGPLLWMFYRLLWCLICAALGMAIKSMLLIRKPNPAWFAYFITYPIFLIVDCCLIFSILHIFKPTMNLVFYPFSFALCFYAGFGVPKILELVKRLFDRAASKL